MAKENIAYLGDAIKSARKSIGMPSSAREALTCEICCSSKEVNWQGGGSFVYCELAKHNQSFIDEIEAVEDGAALADIYDRIVKSGFISHKVNPADIDLDCADFKELSLDDKKRFLMELLDKNLLYVNYCDIDDKEFAISDEDKAFTRSFYNEG